LSNNFLKNKIFEVVSQVTEELDVRAFVIGGYVRDLHLNRPSKDIDIVVEGKGIELALAVAKKVGNPKVSIFKSFGTAMFNYKGLEIEFVWTYFKCQKVVWCRKYKLFFVGKHVVQTIYKI